MKSISDELTLLMDRNNLNQRYIDLMEKVMADPDVKSFVEMHDAELTADAVNRSFAKLYEFYQEKIHVAKHENTQIPGYEPELVMSNHLIDIAYQPTTNLLKKRAQEKLERRVRSISIPKNVRNASLSDFTAPAKSSRLAVLAQMVEFIDAYEKTPNSFHQGIYLQGEYGIGKTYLMVAVANELAARGFQTTLIHFPSFAVEMKSSISTNTFVEKTNAIKKAPILMIDDIGADSESTWIRDDVLGVILEYRMQEELATFFTSNKSMQSLKDSYLTISSQGDQEPIKAQRIMQRIRFLSTEMIMTGPNRRLNPIN